jgi:hypothetical protein
VTHHFVQLASDPVCPHHLDVFLDLSETTSLPESTQLRDVGNEIAGIRVRVKFGSCAIVAGGDALFGMMKEFEGLARQHFDEMRVFRVVAEAEEWLARH